jgi:phenylalanyl-tRNA synthetase beta chain
MALSISFVDEQKTMTDADIDGFMNKIMRRYETDLSAEIRK